jgi:hypothetical protein
MTKINCRNVRREIEEAGPDDVLSAEVDQHLANCVACGTLAREQASLQRIVSSLGTIEAPGDFDFRLRARLAADNRRSRPFAFAGLSFGVRSAALAMMLILAGAAILYMALRSQPNSSAPTTVAGNGQRVTPQAPPSDQSPSTPPSATTPPERVEAVATGSDGIKTGSDGVNKTSAPLPSKRRPAGESVASNRGSRTGTRDLSGHGAVVLKNDQFADGYRGSAFPIDASYQSLKVSVDDGRGSSRTISLPSVSFGSQRTLSQGAAPLVASARGAW